MFESHDDFIKRRTRRMNRPLITAEEISRICNKPGDLTTTGDPTDNYDRFEMLQEEIKHIEAEGDDREARDTETYLQLVSKGKVNNKMASN